MPRCVRRYRALRASCVALPALLLWSLPAHADMPPRKTPIEEVYSQFDMPEPDEDAELEMRHEYDSCRRRDMPEDAVDRARLQLEQTTCSAALWFDGLFGDERHVDKARRAYGRLETSIERSDFYGTKSRTRFDLRVDLPNLQERLSLFIGRDSEERIDRDRREGFALSSEFPELDDRDQFFAGVGYGLPRRERVNVDFRVGVRSVSSPRAFVQTRLHFLPYADDNEVLQIRLTPFYNTRDGFGVTPGLDYSFVISPRLLARWSNIATFSETTEGVDWRSATILYQGLGWGRGIAYEAFVRGMTDAQVPLREYGLRLIYRQPIFRYRLFMQPLAGYSWPREETGERREAAYLVGFGLEMPFGHKY